MDSGLLLALMSKSAKSWRTYTVGFGTSFEDDELEDARRMAQLFSSDHTSVEMTQATFEHALAKVVSAVEEPGTVNTCSGATIWSAFS